MQRHVADHKGLLSPQTKSEPYLARFYVFQTVLEKSCVNKGCNVTLLKLKKCPDKSIILRFGVGKQKVHHVKAVNFCLKSLKLIILIIVFSLHQILVV